MVKKELGPAYEEMVEEPKFFVDFMRDAPEPTGEEDHEVFYIILIIYMIYIIIYIIYRLTWTCPESTSRWSTPASWWTN